jgi:hypothetical protein
MNNLFALSVTVPEHVLMRELDGESVILDLNDEDYYGLDEIGTRIWQVLIESDTIGDAIKILTSEYAVEPGQLEKDLEEFVTDLVDKKLMVVETISRE